MSDLSQVQQAMKATVHPLSSKTIIQALVGSPTPSGSVYLAEHFDHRHLEILGRMPGAWAVQPWHPGMC